MVLLVVVLGSLSDWGYTEHGSARHWRADQLSTASRLASSRRAAAALQVQLSTTQGKLAASQELDTQLAAEKKDLSDQRAALADVLGTALP
jgi:hypothetical protein